MIPKDKANMSPKETFGPQWEQVLSFAERAKAATADEIAALAEAAYLSDEEAENLPTSLYIAKRHSRQDMCEAAEIFTGAETDKSTVWDSVDEGMRYAAGSEVDRAVRALVVRDLINTHDDFSQQDYDRLTAAFARILGPVHPDDLNAGERSGR